MRRSGKFVILLCGVLMVAGTGLAANFTFPVVAGPLNVVGGTPYSVNFNDAANTAGVTAPPAGEFYTDFTLTANWTAGAGNPWSSEAELQLYWGAAATLVDIDPPTSGGLGNGNATTLTFTGSIVGYDPSVDATIDVDLGQSFAGSDANWSNVTLTLSTPNIPATVGTLNPDDSASNAHAANTVSWYLIIHPGGDLSVYTDGSSFDTELGIYDAIGVRLANDDDGGAIPTNSSNIQLAALPAGNYYAAASGYNTTFGAAGFTVTGGTATGTLAIEAVIGLVPVELQSFVIE